MKTTRFVPGNKLLVQLADRGIAGAPALLAERVSTVRKTLRGGNGGLKAAGWPVWLWQDAKAVLGR